MRKKKIIVLLAVFAVAVGLVFSRWLAVTVSPQEQTLAFLEEYVPMRDGVRLYTRVFLPDTDVWGPGPYPVIVARTPYGVWKQPEPGAPLHGYAFVYQDTRGRWYSNGTDRLFYDDATDGYDTIDWIVNQTWCNGKVGLEGGSALGITAYLAAGERHPNVVAALAYVSSGDLYNDLIYDGAAFRFADAFMWALSNTVGLSDDHLMKVVPPSEWEYIPEYQEDCSDIYGEMFSHRDINFPNRPVDSEWLMNLPLKAFHPNFSVLHPFMDEVLSHPSQDGFRDYLDALDTIDVPIMHVGGWYDFFAKCTVDAFVSLQNRGDQKLFMAPGTHGNLGGLPHSFNFIYFGWFDYWLKGVNNGIIDEPMVSYYCLGAEEWRSTNQWPPPEVQYINYYLHSAEVLNTDPCDVDEKAESYVYDPRDPVLTRGGRNLILPAGSYDQRPVREGRHDILTYTSDELAEDVEVTGPVKAFLSASSNCTDTDFAVKLMDVHPDGSAMLVIDNIIRARYRESMGNPTLMMPGNIYDVPIILGDISHLFKAGHRIQVDISSSNFPKHDRNLNTGGNLYTETEEDLLVANNTIHHDAEHPSYIVIPIIGEDITPPTIENVSQQPPGDSVYPDSRVEVYANVTDGLSGVKRVTLNYTNGNGTWISVDMTGLEGNVWNATIHAFPYCTTVTYVIIAEDNANNAITTEEMEHEYQYHVIPEVPPSVFLTLFMMATLLVCVFKIPKGSARKCMHVESRIVGKA